MLENLLQLDLSLFGFVNQSLANPMFDFLMPLFRSKFFWIPLYLLILVLLAIKLKWKSISLVILIVLTIFISDKISSELIKKTVCRVRPCNEITLSESLIKRVECGNGYSFTSTHAANHFAFAHIFTLILVPFLSSKKSNRRLYAILSYFWAFSIAFAQVYVGVHYPSDVMAGALLGLLLASLTYALYKTMIKNKLQ